MKKNMLAVVILALTLVNVSLSAILLFTVVPKAKRTDKLIEKIVAAVDLETESGLGKSYGEVKTEDQELIVLYKDKVLVNLKEDGGRAGIAQVSITLTLNKKHDDYAKIKDLIPTRDEKVLNETRSILKDYTVSEVTEYAKEINAKALEAMKELFQTGAIIDVTVDAFAVQQ